MSKIIHSIFVRLDGIDMEHWLTNYFQKNWKQIRLFLSLFAINILVYGQQLFFHSLQREDFARFFINYDNQVSWNGRWGTDIFNNYIFTGALHILPFVHILFGIFSITLAGFLTAYFWKQNKVFHIVIITLLCSSSVVFSGNLSFITNISAWVTTPLGVFSLFLFYHRSFWIKFIAIFLLAFSIGCYQTIIQVCLLSMVIKITLELWQVKNNVVVLQIIKNHIPAFFCIVLSAIIYLLINYLLLDTTPASRFAIATQIQSPHIYFFRVLEVFQSIYNNILHTPTKPKSILEVFLLLNIAILIVFIFFQKPQKNLFYSFFFPLILFFCFCFIVFLQNILGNTTPFQAHYTINWLLASTFVFAIRSHTLFKNLSILIVFIYLIATIYIINVYAYGEFRQTQLEIIRANQMISAIRNNASYKKEPAVFYIAGTNYDIVIGKITKQSVFNSGWSKYSIFYNFTDFNFQRMSELDYQKIKQKLIAKGELIPAYPAKSSIYIDEENVVVFFDPSLINQKILANQKKEP